MELAGSLPSFRRRSIDEIFLPVLLFTVPFVHALAVSTYLTITNLVLFTFFVLVAGCNTVKVNIDFLLTSVFIIICAAAIHFLHIFQYGGFDFSIFRGIAYFLILLNLWHHFLNYRCTNLQNLSRLVSIVTIYYGWVLFAEYVLANFWSVHLLDMMPRYSTGAVSPTSFFGFRSRGFSSEPSHVANLFGFLALFSLFFVCLKAKAKYRVIFFISVAAGLFSSFSTSALATLSFSVSLAWLLNRLEGKKLAFRFVCISVSAISLYVIAKGTSYGKLLSYKLNNFLQPDLDVPGGRGARMVLFLEDLKLNTTDYVFGNPFFRNDLKVNTTLSSYIDISIAYGFMVSPVILLLITILLIQISKMPPKVRGINSAIFLFVLGSMFYHHLIFTTYGPFMISMLIFSVYYDYTTVMGE